MGIIWSFWIILVRPASQSWNAKKPSTEVVKARNLNNSLRAHWTLPMICNLKVLDTQSDKRSLLGGGLGRVGLDFVLQRPLDSLDWCYQNWWMLSKLRRSPWFWLEYFQQVHNPAQLDWFGSLRTKTYSYATVGVELSKLEARDLNILLPNEQWN